MRPDDALKSNEQCRFSNVFLCSSVLYPTENDALRSLTDGSRPTLSWHGAERNGGVIVGKHDNNKKQSFMYSRWRLVAFNLEGVLARACALPELVHVPAEAVASLDSLSKEVSLALLFLTWVLYCSPNIYGDPW